MSLAKKILCYFFLITSSFFSPSLIEGAQAATASKPEKTKLCLTMIVKNESRIIERCLGSVKDIVDCISICDTGSTDNTIALIEKFMQTNNIPGKVHRHEWKNFGHNRSLSVLAAQQTLKDLNFSIPDSYLLLIDADMMLEVDPAFSKSELNRDSYLVLQKATDLSYYNTRLIHASLPWVCVGVTHEYWSAPSADLGTQLKTLVIDDRNDGGCKADKFERDIRLLTQGLKDEPDNERYVFYLAQSHMCLSQYEEAIKWYQERIKRGGWKEEVWFSKFMIGECYEGLGKWDLALQAYLEAYQFTPTRAEPLQKIANYYRLHNQPELAYMFAKQGQRIPYPTDHLLFVSHPVYDYQFDEELSIAAFYTRYRDEGFDATDRLILKRNVPGNVKEQAYRNLQYYVQHINLSRYAPINIQLPTVRPGSQLFYNPMNPSILKTDEGYTVICRTANYLQNGGHFLGWLDPLDKSETVRTRNFLVKYDKNFNLLSQKEIIEDLKRERIHRIKIEGLEDCRLVALNKDLWFTCTTCDTNPCGTQQISACRLESTGTDHIIQVDKLTPLIGPNLNRCEKNWLPFVKDNALHMVYSFDPFIIYKPNLETGECETVVNYTPSHDFSHFRGSASPIPFDDGYLLLIHEVAFTDKRYYFHRFVYLDKDFMIKKVSRPFMFLLKGVEYCCGMTTDHSEKDLILTFGIEDREASFCFINLDIVRSMLRELPK